MRDYSILILAGDASQYQELVKMIPFREHRLTLLPSFPETDLFDSFRILKPDIVIVDECFLTPEFFEKIKKTTSKGFGRHLFVLCDEAAGTLNISVQLGNAVIINKPVDGMLLMKHLDHAVKRLDWNNEHNNFLYEATRYYFNRVFIERLGPVKSIREINEEFGFLFEEGIFRVLIIKFDYDGDCQQIYGKFFPLQRMIEKILDNYLLTQCFEIVLCYTFDGLIASINYSRENREEVNASFNPMLREIRQACESLQGTSATLCLGKEYEEISGLVNSRADAHAAVWARSALGINRVIRAEEAERFQFPQKLEMKYAALHQRINREMDSLNVEGFAASMKEAFQVTKEVFCTIPFYNFLHEIILDFFRMHDTELSKLSDVELLRNKATYLMIMSSTMEQCEENITEEISELMMQLTAFQSKDYSSHVQSALSYIRLHYSESISLDEIAEYIGISPSYLSSTFKTETGIGLSNYISCTRINNACRMLRQTSSSIAEIAETVNFDNSTYFGKQFRKYVGMTPTEYRKIFSNAGNEKARARNA